MRATAYIVLILTAAVAGCAHVQSDARSVHDHIPFMYHDQKVATDDAAPVARQAHRQYYDKLHKRYYYYDPVQKAYFWENGVPKDR
jgi:hypothetical protein